jgi:alpha-glucosidase
MNARHNDLQASWQEGAIVYQIYPRSFMDANGDGVGDLRGIISRISHLEELGVNAVWLSPFYPSPMADFGYDVADYTNVDPLFGNLDDFKDLLKALHHKKIKLIVDLVPNHTSDEHEWFKQSRKSRNNPYADWYVWQDAKVHPFTGEKTFPNNWRDALTGRPAWEWEETRQQYYLHSFHVKQPDLNHTNQEVREAIKNVMRFWLDLGVDGFRVDVADWIAKDPILGDDGLNTEYVEGDDLLYHALIHDRSKGWPTIFAYLSEMAEVLKEEKYRPDDRFMVLEAYPKRQNLIASYMNFYVGIDPKVAAPFNFEGLLLPWHAPEWHRFLKGFHTSLDQFDSHCVASYAFGNHDQSRIVDRFGIKQARSAAVMQLTLPGMIFIYYGEEIGMQNADIPPELIQDPAAKGDPKNGIGRDPERSPMQWDASPQAGFSTNAKTWLPIADNYTSTNVTLQKQDTASFYSLYKKLCHMRNSIPALKLGKIKILDFPNPDILGFIRYDAFKEKYITLINFSKRPTNVSIDGQVDRQLVSSDPETNQVAAGSSEITLLPYEGCVYSLHAK